jgi:hypothetical protein
MKKLIIALILLNVSAMFGQGVADDLPELFGNGTAGTDFYLTFHPTIKQNIQGESILIYIAAKEFTEVTFSIGSKGVSQKYNIMPDKVLAIDVDPNNAHPYDNGTGGITTPPEPAQIWENTAIRIESDKPVVVYGVLDYKYNSEGFLALPVNTWGQSYIVSSWTDPTSNQGNYSPSYTSIIAAYDNTHVTFKLGGRQGSQVKLDDGEFLNFGEIMKKTLFKGDVLLIPGSGPYNDLTGSVINSNKPVGVVSGQYCGFVPINRTPCNYLIEMETPIETWGKEYLIAPVDGLSENPMIKIYPGSENTQIYRDGNPIGKIKEVGGLSGVGYVEMRAAEGEQQPVLIYGDKPINVVHMSQTSDNDDISRSAFQMNLLPTENFYKKVTWSSPEVSGEDDFNENFINLIFLADEEGNIPNDIKLSYYESGDKITNQLAVLTNSDDIFSFNKTDSESNREWKCATVKLLGYGLYELDSPEPVGVYAYGFGQFESYGFPAGAQLKKANTGIGDVKAPKLTGETGLQSMELTVSDIYPEENSSGLSVIYPAKLDNFNFDVEPFIAGQDVVTEIRLEVKNIYKSARAEIFATDRVGNDTVFVFEYSVPLNDNITFASENNTIRENITHMPIEAELTISNENENLGTEINFFGLDGVTKGVVLEIPDDLIGFLNPGESRTVKIKFNPAEPALAEFSFDFNINDNVTKSADFSFEAVYSAIEASDVAFFEIIEKESKSGELEIENTGDFKVQITNIVIQDTDNFSLEEAVPDDAWIGVGESAKFIVNFHPEEPGDYETSATIESDAYDGDFVAILNGKAIVNSVENKDELITATTNYIAGKLVVDLPENTTSRGLTISDMAGRPVYSTTEIIQPGRTEIELSGNLAPALTSWNS